MNFTIRYFVLFSLLLTSVTSVQLSMYLKNIVQAKYIICRKRPLHTILITIFPFPIGRDKTVQLLLEISLWICDVSGSKQRSKKNNKMENFVENHRTNFIPGCYKIPASKPVIIAATSLLPIHSGVDEVSQPYIVQRHRLCQSAENTPHPGSITSTLTEARIFPSRSKLGRSPLYAYQRCFDVFFLRQRSEKFRTGNTYLYIFLLQMCILEFTVVHFRI